MDAYKNYMNKPGKELEQPEPKSQFELERQPAPERQPDQALVVQKAPAQGPPAPPLLALPNTQSVILDKLNHLRQTMINHFDQIDRRISDLETTIEAIFDEVQEIQVIVETLQAAWPSFS